MKEKLECFHFWTLIFVRKLGFRDVKSFVQGHIGNFWQKKNSKPGIMLTGSKNQFQ